MRRKFISVCYLSYYLSYCVVLFGLAIPPISEAELDIDVCSHSYHEPTPSRQPLARRPYVLFIIRLILQVNVTD